MLRSGGDQVNAGGFDGAVSQHIGQFYDVPADPVKGCGKKMAQIMGEHLGRGYPGTFTQPLHLRPNLAAGEWLSVSGEKNLTRNGFLLLRVFQQLAAELVGEQDDPHLALGRDLRPAPSSGLHGDVPHLAHPDAGGADGFHEQGQTVPAQVPGRVQQTDVFRAGQIPALVPEQPPLNLQKLHPALLPAQKAEQAIDGRQHGIDGDRGVARCH